jgi:hypothetical protein
MSLITDELEKGVNQTTLQRDVDALFAQMEEKMDAKLIIEQLDSKASKESVKAALQRKIGKSEFEQAMSLKTDLVRVFVFIDRARCRGSLRGWRIWWILRALIRSWI